MMKHLVKAGSENLIFTGRELQEKQPRGGAVVCHDQA